jgi:hypothetical protein
MSEKKEPETKDSIALDTQPEEEEGEDAGTEGNESEPLKSIIESDQAVEPDVKVTEELKVLREKEDMATAYNVAKTLIPESTISKKQQRRRQRQRLQKETTALINISKQLDKQTTEIKRISSILQSIQKSIKPLERQRSELIKLIQKQTSQIQKYITQKKKRKR